MLSLYRYGFRLAGRETVLVCLLSGLDAGLMVAAPLLVGQVIGRAPGVVAGGPLGAFAVVLTVLLFVVPLANIVRLLAETYVEKIDGLVQRDQLLRLGRAGGADPLLRALDNPNVAARIARVRSRNWEVQFGVRQTQGQLITQSLTLLGGAVALSIALSWWVALAMLAGAVGEALYFRRVVHGQMDVWSGQTEHQKHAQYAFEQGMGKAAKEVRIFGLAGYLRQRYWDNVTAAYRPYWRLRWRQAGTGLFVGGGRMAVTAGALAYAGWAAERGQLSLTRLSTALPLILTVAMSDMWMVGMVERAAVTLRWLEELAPGGPVRSLLAVGDQLAGFGTPAPVASPGRPPRGPSTPRLSGATPAGLSDRPPEIVFERVSFAYPGHDERVLADLSVVLPAGQATALVGVNGAGKSTLVKLIAGAYRPTRGRVLVDGVDLACLDTGALREHQRRIAAITQDFVRLPLPAGDNVELGTGTAWAGRIDASVWPPTTGLDAVAARAGIEDLVARLPSGWATPLDKTIPGGVDLSGGEWQRVGLARALRAVEAGAGMLVLDEPAAALDVPAEARLVAGYLDLASRVTSLVISHRFSVVRPVPRICVLAGGRVVEQGSHEQLMAAGGLYRRMFSLQASRYVVAEAARPAERDEAS